MILIITITCTKTLECMYFHYSQGCLSQGWIKCRSGEHRSQEMTRKIEEIVTLENEERRGRKEKEEKKEEVEIEELTEEEEEHGDDN